MSTAPVNGIDLYYEEHGKGFPVVLAHGAGGNHLSWWQQIPALSKQYRCITFDHRGWGLSLDAGGIGPQAFVDDLRGLLDHLDVEQAFLAGQSMGGYTCLGFTLRQPERVRGLVMANTFAGMRREAWLAAPEDVRAHAHGIWERRGSDGVKRAFAPDFARREKARAFLYKQIRMLNEHGPNELRTNDQVQRLRALERAPDSSASRESLASLRVPVLFIGGEHDEVMPVRLMAVARSLIPEARMEVVAGAGHSVYFEAAETFNRLALDFFASCVG
ncbi:MAG TPA: alpha/beta hydrolase [Dehalococcoidia bacterium]|nr:alpha/beta hydrolase [Dehalococcoidia bacterium]